ncbi:MAG TPA: hypothetical protein VI488_11665 [Candidatus Angelobacter sp.]
MASDDLDNNELDEAATEATTDELQTRIEELETRIEEMESGSEAGTAGISVLYALGMCIAVVLSWSRNASILWCILHGFFSWGYVIYFACTR